MAKQKITSNDIETTMKKLEKIVDDMRDENCSLEKSFELYKKGINLCKEAQDSIQKIEGKIKILEGNNEY
ncbi:MAG: exodeoxyribonuclease VII small subunit [Eubacteriales bacterium]|nr:exodeoxyribonuclease VII small subunit [Eubacteriales bacterium]